MSFGGGYSAPADNSLELQREQQAYDDKLRAEELARQEAEEAEQRATYNTALDAAVSSATNRANRTLTSRGLDPNDYTDLISGAIADQRSLVPDLDTNPAGYFSNDFIDNVLNTEQSNRRNAYTNQVNTAFPVNADYGLFADTADDSYITDILNTQKQSALNSLDMAYKRGNLNSTGYDSALAALDEMYSSGLSQAQSLGSGVLSDYRTQLNDIADSARTAAGNYTLGGTWDLSPYTERYNTLNTDLQSRLGGDIGTALGSEDFFDLGDILTRGGNAQGATNPRTALADVLAERERVRNTDRGVSGTSAGVF